MKREIKIPVKYGMQGTYFTSQHLEGGRGGIHYRLKLLFIVTSEDETTHIQIQNCTYM